MRTNGFGDRYCHTVDEARGLIDEHTGEVYVPSYSFDPPESTFGATAEIVDCSDGEVVCYIEAPTEADVRAIIAELGIEIV